MTTQQLLGLDLLSTVAGTALLFGAAVLTLAGRVGSRSAGIGALACGGLAIPATAGRVAVDAALAGDGWWFVADKVLLALPLALVTAAFAVVAVWPTLARVATGSVDAPSRRRAAAGLFIAGYGSAAGLLVVFVVGYPVDPVSGAVVVVLVGHAVPVEGLAVAHAQHVDGVDVGERLQGAVHGGEPDLRVAALELAVNLLRGGEVV